MESFKSGNACLLTVLLVILIFTIFSIPVYAAVEELVVKDSNGDYHQYCYQALLDSYALKLLSRSDGLYEDFAAKKPAAVLNSSGSYICYNAVLDQYTLALLRGKSFNLSQYVESSTAKKAVMPEVVKVITLSEGTIVRMARNLGQDASPGAGVAVTVSQPRTGLKDPASAQPVSNPTAFSEETPEPVPNNPLAITPLVSTSQVSLSRAQQWAAARGAHQQFIDIAPLYWEYGQRTGLCSEMLYAQSAYETNFGRYTGIVPPEYNNWAGIKIATSNGDKPEDHQQFATPEDGVRAHFNHIAAYTGLDPIGEPHGRYHLIMRLSWAGTVKTVEELSGKWAPSSTYHERIIVMLEEMKH